MSDNTPGNNPLIISAPALQTLKQRFSSSLITLLFWLFWLYFWQPLISLITWLVGIKIFHEQMIRLGGLQGLLGKLSSYLTAVCTMAIVFFGWAYYNNRRFKIQQRRKTTWRVSYYNLGNKFRLTQDQVLHIKVSRRLVIDFDENSRIISLDNK